MEDYTPMNTPRVSNLKESDSSYLEWVDSRVYRQFIGISYIWSTLNKIFFSYEHVISVHGGSKTSVVGNREACAHISQGNNGVWIEVYWM